MKGTCPNCKSNFEIDHFFCPDCGFDLRQNQIPPNTISQPKPKSKKRSIVDLLGSPWGSFFVCLIIGTIVMEIINGYYKYFGNSNSDTASIIESILGSGLGFLVMAAAPSLIISLIFLVINKKFPKDAFVTMLYVFTFLVAWFWLSTLYN